MVTHFDPHAHVDYMSVTFPEGAFALNAPDGLAVDYAKAALTYFCGSPELAHMASQFTGTEREGLHGFTRRFSWDDAGLFVQWGAGHGKAHVVASGAGCAIIKSLYRAGILPPTGSPIFDPERLNFTRIDLAVDVSTDEKPSHVAPMVYPRKGTSTGHVESSTGETIYFGSRQSERMLRIYKYNPPHPRAHLLRWEWELKGNHARQVAAALYTGLSLWSIIRELCQEFGVLYHPIWLEIGETPPTPLSYKKRADSGHVMWLYKVCIPAMRKALQEGTITRADIIKALGE